MFKLVKMAVPMLLLAVCGACDREISQESREISLESDDMEFFEFFNPFYQIPESALDQLCVVDVKVGPMGEKEFIAKIDRISDDTGNGIMYSNPVTRDRVVYTAPVDCGKLKQKGAYSPTKYFDQVLSFKKTNASEHPYAASPSEFVMKKFVADLKNAAVAAEFDFDRPASKGVGEKQITDLLCVSNANLRAQSRFGLPFTHIFAEDHSILYLYNTYSVDTELVQYLVESGLSECRAKYGFQIRALNNTELNYVSTITVEQQEE